MANTFIFDDDESQPDDTPNMDTSPEGDAEDGAEEGGESNNRTFMIVAVVLGGIILLSLICAAIVAVVWLPSRNATVAATQEYNNAIAAETEMSLQQTATAALFTPTLPPTETPTPAPSATPVLVFATETPAGQAAPVGPATATVEALQTQLVASNLTATAQATLSAGTPSSTPTALPDGGFADDVGLTGLFLASFVLVAVILLARRLRAAPQLR